MQFFQDHHCIDDYKITNLAMKMGFKYDLPKKKIKNLSGGEKAKLQLMQILLGGYNVLLLDEPTNHLDLELLESLEKVLLDFKGAIIFVSHDRYFVKKIATRILEVRDYQINEIQEH